MAQQATVRPVEAPEVATGEPPSTSDNGTSPDQDIPKGFSAETWEAITRLWHFLPDYPYEPQHQYFDDRTTDPDYPIEDFSVLTSPEHQSLAHSIYTTLRAWMPDHVRKEQDLRHIGLDSQVQPDIVVAADPVRPGADWISMCPHPACYWSWKSSPTPRRQRTAGPKWASTLLSVSRNTGSAIPTHWPPPPRRRHVGVPEPTMPPVSRMRPGWKSTRSSLTVPTLRNPFCPRWTRRDTENSRPIAALC